MNAVRAGIADPESGSPPGHLSMRETLDGCSGDPSLVPGDACFVTSSVLLGLLSNWPGSKPSSRRASQARQEHLANAWSPFGDAASISTIGFPAPCSAGRERFLRSQTKALGSCTSCYIAHRMRQALLLGLSVNLYRLWRRYIFLRLSTPPGGF